MYLTPLETLCMILAVAAGTQLTRRKPPQAVTDLGRLLPAAMMGLLVVYCLKDVSWTAPTHGAPEALAVLAVGLLHRWRENVLLSIAGGTVLYMLLVQVVFP